MWVIPFKTFKVHLSWKKNWRISFISFFHEFLHYCLLYDSFVKGLIVQNLASEIFVHVCHILKRTVCSIKLRQKRSWECYKAVPDVHYPTPTGCLFSWLVWTTHQDAIKMPWLSSELCPMSWTLLRALMGNNTMNALLLTKKENYWQPIPVLRLQRWSL